MIDGLLTIAGGLLAASALIIARKPNAAALIDKLTPAQGWIGVVMFFWGVWNAISIIRHLGALMHAPLFLVVGTGLVAMQLVVGFLLGFGLITKWTLSGNPMAMARGQAIRQKLAAYQGVFGLIAIATGSLFVVLNVV
ncbi:MAG: hypothetical protein H0V17_13090 [Deltaproteobacteria bacterium]|nr:hypothetical protein [Deltaproteobacteria bacterium]